MTSPAEPMPATPGAGSDNFVSTPRNSTQRSTPPIPPTTTRESVFDAGLEPDEPDWPAQATTAIVNLVGTVRDKTTGSVLTAARAIVFGMFAAILALALVVLLLILSIRFLAEATGQVWIAYLILGVIFTVAGLIVFRKRLPGTE